MRRLTFCSCRFCAHRSRLAGPAPSDLWIENDRALKQLTVDVAAIDAEMTRRGL